MDTRRQVLEILSTEQMPPRAYETLSPSNSKRGSCPWIHLIIFELLWPKSALKQGVVLITVLACLWAYHLKERFPGTSWEAYLCPALCAFMS